MSALDSINVPNSTTVPGPINLLNLTSVSYVVSLLYKQRIKNCWRVIYSEIEYGYSLQINSWRAEAQQKSWRYLSNISYHSPVPSKVNGCKRYSLRDQQRNTMPIYYSLQANRNNLRQAVTIGAFCRSTLGTSRLQQFSINNEPIPHVHFLMRQPATLYLAKNPVLKLDLIDFEAKPLYKFCTNDWF